MNESKKPGEYRKELYEYLEGEGFEMTEERHDKISNLVKMAATASNEDKALQINRLSNKLFLYKEKYGEIEAGKKKEKQNDPKNTPHPEIKKEPEEPKGNGFYTPKSFR